ncbi:MAG: DUF1127 domain-containing protein [Silicimonas sp.]
MQPTQALRSRRYFATWGSAAGRVLRDQARRASDRREYRQLMSLDDRILKDIGITRDAVHHEILRTYRWMG